jgi:hypothetical protein
MPGLASDHSIPRFRGFKEENLGHVCGVPGIRAEAAILSKGKLLDLQKVIDYFGPFLGLVNGRA